MPKEYSFDINANPQPAISQIQAVNTALQNLGKNPIPIKAKIDTKSITSQLNNLKATIQLTPNMGGTGKNSFSGQLTSGINKGLSGSNLFGGQSSTGVNQAIKRWTQAAQITNAQGASRATKQMASVITAGADQTQAEYARRVKLFQRAISSTNDTKTRNSLQNKLDQFTESRVSDMTSAYSKQWQSLSDKFNKSLDSVYQKGRDFGNAVNIDDLRKQIDDLGDTLNNEKTWGGNKPQEFANRMAQAQDKLKTMMDSSNITMDTPSMAKYAQKMQRTLDGYMSHSTRQMGKKYLSQITDAMAGNSKIYLKDWKSQNIPNMEAFMARAAQENNSGAGFLRRVGASLKGQNAALIGSLLSTQSLRQMTSKMASNTKAVDSAMVELRKVSNQSPAELKESGNMAFRMAQQYGARGTDVINSMADWSRLNYQVQ